MISMMNIIKTRGDLFMKKVPLRKCVATGEQPPKKELIRIVKNKEGEVSVDPTGKKERSWGLFKTFFRCN